MPTTPPLSGDGLHFGVPDVPGVVVQGAGAGMADGHRAFGGGDGLRNRALAAVRQVEQQLFLFDALDGGAAELRQAGIRRLQRPVARQVAQVVGQLDDADAEAFQRFQPVEIEADHGGVLGAIDQRDAARCLGGADVGGAAAGDEDIRVGGDHAAEMADVADRHVPILAFVADGTDRDVEGGNAARQQFGTPARGEQDSVLFGGRVIGAAQPVDDGGLAVIEGRALRPRNGRQRRQRRDPRQHLAPCRVHRACLPCCGER